MSLVLVNVLLAVGVVAMLLVALVVLRRLRKQAIMIALRYTEWALGPFLPVINSHFPDQTSYDEYVGHLMGTTIRRRAERIVAIVRLLNVVSTTLALVPLGFAVYNI